MELTDQQQCMIDAIKAVRVTRNNRETLGERPFKPTYEGLLAHTKLVDDELDVNRDYRSHRGSR
jgi:hypothetical protein